MKVGGKHKKKTQIRVRGDKALRVRKLLEIWKKDTGPDMAQVWPMLDHSLNAMICEWYVESGRFDMYQYMTRGWVKMKESRVMKEYELEELQTESPLIFFFIQENKHVISWCFSLLSFNLCQIWSIYFRASEYVTIFGPVKFSYVLTQMACNFPIPKSLTVSYNCRIIVLLHITDMFI